VFDYPCEAGWPHSIVAFARDGSGVVATRCARSSPYCPANGANRAGFKETVSRPR
jgi:hypothetical protein